MFTLTFNQQFTQEKRYSILFLFILFSLQKLDITNKSQDKDFYYYALNRKQARKTTLVIVLRRTKIKISKIVFPVTIQFQSWFPRSFFDCGFCMGITHVYQKIVLRNQTVLHVRQFSTPHYLSYKDFCRKNPVMPNNLKSIMQSNVQYTQYSTVDIYIFLSVSFRIIFIGYSVQFIPVQNNVCLYNLSLLRVFTEHVNPVQKMLCTIYSCSELSLKQHIFLTYVDIVTEVPQDF